SQLRRESAWASRTGENWATASRKYRFRSGSRTRWGQPARPPRREGDTPRTRVRAEQTHRGTTPGTRYDNDPVRPLRPVAAGTPGPRGSVRPAPGETANRRTRGETLSGRAGQATTPTRTLRPVGRVRRPRQPSPEPSPNSAAIRERNSCRIRSVVRNDRPV